MDRDNSNDEMNLLEQEGFSITTTRPRESLDSNHFSELVRTHAAIGINSTGFEAACPHRMQADVGMSSHSCV